MTSSERPLSFFKLSKTGYGRASHSHVAYLSEERREGLCSVNRGHTHEIQWIEPQAEQPEQQDPQTGEIIPAQPAIAGGWQVLPDVDGHSHSIEELEIDLVKARKLGDSRDGKEEESDNDIVSDVWMEWQEAMELEIDSYKKGERAEDFFFGDQWESVLSQRLREEGRACVTKNFTQKYIDDLVGVVREERKEFRFSPKEGGDKGVADLLSFIAKDIQDRNYYQRERAKFFEDLVIPGKAAFNLSVDFTKNLEGDIVIERYPWRDVKFGPFEKDDLSDLEYCVKDRLYSLAKIKQLFPNKAKDIEDDFSSYKLGIPTPNQHITTETPYKSSPYRTPVIFRDFKHIDVLRKEVRVIERWRKIYLTVPVALSPERRVYENCLGVSQEDLKSIKTIPGFAVIERVLPKIRITKVAGNVLLSDENPAELAEDDFYIAVGYCKRRDSRYTGKVSLVEDCQMEINKRASQMIDIGNKCANYVHFIDETTFIDENEEKRYLKYSNTPGSVFRVTSVERRPVTEEGVQFPATIAQLATAAKEDLRELLNTTVEPWGANTTGVALQAEQRKVLRGNQFLFDALEFAEIRVGRLLIPLIQRYYSPERVARLALSAPGREEIDIDGTPLSEFSHADIAALFATADLSQYDTSVTQSTFSPTTRIGVNMMLNDLAKSGYPIPPQTIIRFSDLPKAEQDKILKDIDQQNSSQNQEQSATRQMEIEKTLVGQGIIPPSIKQEYNLSEATMINKNPPQGGVGIGQQPTTPQQNQIPQ